MVILLMVFLYPYLSVTQMVLLGIVLGLVWYGYRGMKKSHSYWKDKGISYVPPKFFTSILNMFRRKVSFAEMSKEVYDHFPDERYHGAYQFSSPILVVKDAELLKRIAVKEFESFLNHRPIVDPDADPLFGKNLFSVQGEKWRDLRSTLSPSFTSSKMKMMFVLMEECAQQFVQHFKNVHLHPTNDVIEFEAKDIFSRYTNDVIASTAFGIKCDSLKDKENEFYLMGKDASNLFGGPVRILKFILYMISPFLSKVLKFGIFSTDTRNYFTNIIVETMQTRREQNIIRPDMIHLMMEAQKERTNIIANENKKLEITTSDIVANAFVFFLAGFDTTSTFLTFAFYELAVNPQVQSRLRNEIDAVRKTSSNGAITYEALLGMKYLDAVVSEALRKWPPAFLTDRKANRAHTIEAERPGEKSLVVDEGTVVWLPIFAIHRDPKFHPQPDKFDPERFSDGRKHEMDPFAFLPFGLGPRNCIGSRFALLEGKLLMVHILSSFEVVPIERTKIPVVLDKKELNLRPEGGMWLGFKKID